MGTGVAGGLSGIALAVPCIGVGVGVGVGVLYSNTTFMREITPLLQIRQVAQLMEHYMQPARAPRAKEHTNNPVQRPNFRGHATGDVEVTRDYGKGPSLPTGSKEP